MEDHDLALALRELSAAARELRALGETGAAELVERALAWLGAGAPPAGDL